MNELAQLIVKYLKEELSEEEQEALDHWRRASAQNESTFQSIVEEQQLGNEMVQVLAYDRDAARKKILTLEFPAGRNTSWWKYMAAAAVLVLVTLVVFWMLKPSKHTAPVVATVVKDITPGGNKAVLTLSDNSRIVLDEAQNGMLSQQAGTEINKEDGVLTYKKSRTTNALIYNTLTTPKGGEYQLVLPDGTKALLNAASSITYPVNFIGNERPVKVSGEVYFEVAHDATKPFKVTIDDWNVEVLGTHFNINAYADEPFSQTTLLEGAVKLKGEVLKPGEAARIKGGKLTLVPKADITEVMAWKNGLFYFRNAGIETIMRQVARWYNVEVHYQGNIEKKFSGEIPRNVHVSDLFNILEATGWVHFKIDGRKIVVTP